MLKAKLHCFSLGKGAKEKQQKKTPAGGWSIPAIQRSTLFFVGEGQRKKYQKRKPFSSPLPLKFSRHENFVLNVFYFYLFFKKTVTYEKTISRKYFFWHTDNNFVAAFCPSRDKRRWQYSRQFSDG